MEQVRNLYRKLLATDKKTTENYLDSFENEVKKQFAGKLMTFKNEEASKIGR